MIRNLKALGLAVMAVFAVGAVVASTASAQNGKLTSDGHVTLIGEETGVQKNRLTEFGAFWECPGTVYTGHKYNVTPHESIPSGESTFTLTPHYKEKTGAGVTPTTGEPNCIGSFGWRATFDLNGCDYVLHIGGTTPGVDTYTVTVDIVCPVGKEIVTTWWTNEADHTKAGTAPFCVIHVPPQAGLPGVHATDTTNGHFDLTGTITNIKMKRTAQAEDPSAFCSTSEDANTKIDLDVTVKGLDTTGKATAISISH